MADSINLPHATTTPLTFKKQSIDSDDAGTQSQDLKNLTIGSHQYIDKTRGEDRKELEKMLSNINQILLYCQENNIQTHQRWATVKGNFVMDSAAYNAWLELEANYPQNQNKTNFRLEDEMIPAFLDHIIGSYGNGDQLLKYLRNAKLGTDWYAPRWMSRLKQLYGCAEKLQREQNMPDEGQKKQFFMDQIDSTHQLQLRSKNYDINTMTMTEIAREIGVFQQIDMRKQNKVLSEDGLKIISRNNDRGGGGRGTSNGGGSNSRKRGGGRRDDRQDGSNKRHRGNGGNYRGNQHGGGQPSWQEHQEKDCQLHSNSPRKHKWKKCFLNVHNDEGRYNHDSAVKWANDPQKNAPGWFKAQVNGNERKRNGGGGGNYQSQGRGGGNYQGQGNTGGNNQSYHMQSQQFPQGPPHQGYAYHQQQQPMQPPMQSQGQGSWQPGQQQQQPQAGTAMNYMNTPPPPQARGPGRTPSGPGRYVWQPL